MRKTKTYTWNEDLQKMMSDELPQDIEALQHDKNDLWKKLRKAKESRAQAIYGVPPLPPMNKDGSFKSLNQMLGERRTREWEAQKADEALIAEMDDKSANDPEQIAWEREQGICRKQVRQVEYEIVIPDGVKAIFYVALFVACVIGLIYTGG